MDSCEDNVQTLVKINVLKLIGSFLYVSSSGERSSVPSHYSLFCVVAPDLSEDIRCHV